MLIGTITTLSFVGHGKIWLTTCECIIETLPNMFAFGWEEGGEAWSCTTRKSKINEEN